MSSIKGIEFRNAGWIIGGRIVQMAIAFVVSILTARYLGPGNYGLIGYATAYTSFFTAFCTLGLNSVIVKEFIDHPDDQGEAIGSTLVMRALASTLSSIMIVGIVCVVDRGERLTIAVSALASLGLIFHIFETINFWFQSQYKSKVTSISILIAYVITSVYKIILLVLGKDVRWFAFATSVDYIAIAILQYAAYRKYHGPKLRFSIAKCKQLLGSSYHYILSSAMVAVYAQTDKLMLKQMLGEMEVGYYTTACALSGMWVFVLQAIIDSMYPTIISLHKGDQEAFRKKNRQLYAIVFYMSFIVTAAFMLLGEFAIQILYGSEYLPATDTLKVVTCYTAFSFLGVARQAWVISEGKQRYLKFINFFAVVINIALNALMIPSMGSLGAAVASLVTQMSTSIILPLFFREMRPNAKLMLEAICLRGIR